MQIQGTHGSRNGIVSTQAWVSSYLSWDWIHPEEPRVNILLPAGPPGDLTEGCLFAVGGGRDANRGGSLLPAEGQEVPSGQGNWIRQELELRAVVSRLMWLLKIEFESARISACS